MEKEKNKKNINAKIYMNEKFFQEIMETLHGNDSNYVIYFYSEHLFRFYL